MWLPDAQPHFSRLDPRNPIFTMGFLLEDRHRTWKSKKKVGFSYPFSAQREVGVWHITSNLKYDDISDRRGPGRKTELEKGALARSEIPEIEKRKKKRRERYDKKVCLNSFS